MLRRARCCSASATRAAVPGRADRRGFFCADAVSRARPAFPPVTIVKPLHGNEWALLTNLSSFCQQDYPGPVQFLFGVHDSADPALQTVDELRRLHPEADITVVADARLYGPNRKISNILNMLPQARHDVLVFADSDVSVGAGLSAQRDRRIAEAGCRARHLRVSRTARSGLLAAPVGQGDQLPVSARRGDRPRARPRASLLRADHRDAARHARKDRRLHAVRAASGRGPCDRRSRAHDRREGGDSAVHHLARLRRNERDAS